MEYAAIVSRWLHILPAITLVGGTIFMRMALVPSLSAGGDQSNDELADQIRARWSTVVNISIGLLLLSGLFSVGQKEIYHQLDMVYRGLLLVKIVLALAIFFIASALSGKSGMAQKLREKESFWLNVTALTSVILVCIAGYMKMQKYEPKQRDTQTTAVTHLMDASL